MYRAARALLQHEHSITCKRLFISSRNKPENNDFWPLASRWYDMHEYSCHILEEKLYAAANSTRYLSVRFCHTIRTTYDGQGCCTRDILPAPCPCGLSYS